MRNKMLVVLGMASIFALGAHAQQQGQTPINQPNSRMPGQVQGTSELGKQVPTALDQSTIKAYVSLVSTPVVVRNAKGELVTDLSEKDFRVFDNSVQQTLEAFEIGGAPLSLVIVVENSSRIGALLPSLRRTGILFTQTVLGEDGEAAMIGYNNDVVKLLDFTDDDTAIENAFINLQPGTSGAHLYDALSTAVRMLRNLPPSRRRVIVTLAEALDTGSEEKLDRVVRDAQIADVTISSVGLSTMAAEVHAPQQQAAPLMATPPGTQGLPPIPGAAYTPTVEQLRNGNIDVGGLMRPAWAFAARKPPVEAAVAATGGLYQSTGPYQSTSPETSIEMAIDQVAEELNTQYMLSYRRSGGDTPGFHQIKVDVVGEALKVRSRLGYYLLP
jgi:VWFA-related protein